MNCKDCGITLDYTNTSPASAGERLCDDCYDGK